MRRHALWVMLTAMNPARPPLTLTDRLDLNRYQGRWYEIARLPNRFQRQCVSDVSAEYRLRPDGLVDVTNRCRAADGSWRQSQGVARQDPGDQRKAALQVRFAPAWLSFLPQVWGDYRVMALSPDHDHALVGSENRRYLWVLAREPGLAQEALQSLLEQAADQGFDVNPVMPTHHTGAD